MPLIEQSGLKGRIELEVRGSILMITPARTARDGWTEAFKIMAEQGDVQPLLNEEETSSWDEEERTC